MTNEQVGELGLEQLALIDSESIGVGQWKAWLTGYQFNDEYPDERYIWLTCALALKAVDSGNFGVGSILIDGGGNVVAQGHNEVYSPYFRSDRHAEMVVMDKFEDAYRNIAKLEGYTLYTSLECCPMCLTRLITSGVNTVLYAAQDITGGMVHKIEDLPSDWIELARRQVYGRARCSPELVNAANQVFLLTADELDEKIKNR